MELKFILHSTLSKSDLDEIVRIKNIHWKYPPKEHLNWIKNNILNDDIHVFLINNDNVLGYLNLIKTSIFFDGYEKSVLGVGNVCVINKEMGLGRELLNQTQQYILEKNEMAILFCKDSLKAFYSRLGWEVIKKEKFNSEKLKDINILLFNSQLNYENIDYNGRNF